MRVLVVLAALLALPVAGAQAAATEPPQLLAPGGKWISGDFLQQTGLNCSTAILGEPYTEVMVSGSASYGGLSSVPKVNDPYWTAFLVVDPGQPVRLRFVKCRYDADPPSEHTGGLEPTDPAAGGFRVTTTRTLRGRT